MCTPIVIDTPNVDLSSDPAKTDPAGTGTTAPGPVSPPPPPAASDGTPVNGADTPQVMAADGQTFTPGGPRTTSTPGDVGTPAGTTTPDATVVLAPPTTGTPDTAAPGGTTPDGTTPTGTGPKPDPVLDQNTLLINSLTELAHHFTDTTASILQSQQDATNALNQGFLNLNDQQKAALAAADQLRKNTGQASRKPNYSLSLAANRRSNSSGQSSTMLTGPTGVPTNTLSLGRAQLLGGQPA